DWQAPAWGRQPRHRSTPARAASGALALALMCGCVSTLDDSRGAGTTSSGAGGASTGSSTVATSTSQAATGGLAGSSQSTGSGGTDCKFACPDGGGSFGPGPGSEPSNASDAARDAARSNDAST